MYRMRSSELKVGRQARAELWLGQQLDELADRKVCLPDNCSQRPAGDLLMVWNGQGASRGMAQVGVATLLISDGVPSLAKRFDDRAPGDDGQLARTETSMRVSFTAPDLKRGKPSAASDRRWSWAASLIFFNASRSLFPWEIHPGSDGHVATYHPLSSRSIRTRISMGDPSSISTLSCGLETVNSSTDD